MGERRQQQISSQLVLSHDSVVLMAISQEHACRKPSFQRDACRACALWDGRKVSMPCGDMRSQDYNGEDLAERCEQD